MGNARKKDGPSEESHFLQCHSKGFVSQRLLRIQFHSPFSAIWEDKDTKKTWQVCLVVKPDLISPKFF